MSGDERYLLVITKNKSSVILECLNSSSMEKLLSEAELNGAICKQLLINDFYPAYRGYRYFDLRNPTTRKIFSLVEIIEITNHPWFVGVQFHPEYKSTVSTPHPLFIHFIKACLNKKN